MYTCSSTTTTGCFASTENSNRAAPDEKTVQVRRILKSNPTNETLKAIAEHIGKDPAGIVFTYLGRENMNWVLAGVHLHVHAANACFRIHMPERHCWLPENPFNAILMEVLKKEKKAYFTEEARALRLHNEHKERILAPDTRYRGDCQLCWGGDLRG
jgi:hypothetical protein